MRNIDDCHFNNICIRSNKSYLCYAIECVYTMTCLYTLYKYALLIRKDLQGYPSIAGRLVVNTQVTPDHSCEYIQGAVMCGENEHLLERKNTSLRTTHISNSGIASHASYALLTAREQKHPVLYESSLAETIPIKGTC